MFKQKKVILSLTVVLVFSFVMVANGFFGFFGSDDEDKLVIDTYTSDPAPRAAMEELVEIYQEKNPDLEIELNITAHEDFKQAIRTWLASDTPPDVFSWFAGERAQYFVNNNLIRDISHIWEEESFYDKFSEGYQRESIFDGKAYFLPHQSYLWGMYYNEEIFAEYDLEVPETWEQFIEVNETLKANGIKPITIGTRFQWTAAAWFDHLNIRINGFDFHQEVTRGEVEFTDQRIVDVFEKWKELLDAGYFIDDAASYTWQEAMGYLESEEAAMYLMGSFIHDSATDSLSQKLDFFRFPAINKSPTAVEAPIDGFMIPKNARNVEAAEDFIRFLGSVEGQRNFVEDVGRVAPNQDMPLEAYDEETRKEMEMLSEAEGIAQFLDRDMNEEFAGRMMDYLVEFWENPHNYEDILARLENERQRFY